MACTINASVSNGIVQTADGSGLLKVQSGGVTTNALAWVNFNGTGTVAIRSSYNVSSITDNGTGDYTVNFATPMSDANYVAVGSATYPAVADGLLICGRTPAQTASSIRCLAYQYNGISAVDMQYVSVAIFGN